MEDFNQHKLLVQKLVKTAFQHNWQYRVEIEKQPNDFDIFVKDISYGPTEIGTEALSIGANRLTYPNSVEPVGISMTMRDHEDERIYNWFNEWAGTVANGDGTVNLPKHAQNGYLRKWRRYQLQKASKGFKEDMTREWEVYPTQLGDITESRDDQGFLEFPIQFIQFRS